ncbi:MAG: SusC/RagA family TonB-linked outer membrane protein [Marinifilaceae bacterium]
MGHNISMLRKLLFVLVAVFSFTCLQAQSKVVTGTVTDANDGMGIPGVSVIVKGTTTGTSTNIDGQFTIDADASSTLVFSFVGYTSQEVLVGNQTQINVVLSTSTENLSEVMVIGYGQVKKGDATGAVFSLKSDDFNQGSTSSPQDLIVGKVAGVSITNDGGQPGAGATIRIRGGSSMSASNDPLIVIDGMPIDNREVKGMSNVLSSINPNDIASFTVLKDASSTAIYGSRASNGVILITTKKGKSGQSMKVDFDSKLSIGTIKETIDVLNATEFTDLVNERAKVLSSVNPDLLGTASTNWQDEIFQTAIGQNYSLGVSGSAKNLPYRVSVGYTDQTGILKTSSMERTTGTLNLSPSFFDDHLKVNVGVKTMFIKNRFADKGAVGSALRMDPTKPVKDSDAKYDKYGGYYTWLMEDGTRNVNGTRNPVAQLKQKADESEVSRLIADASMDYKVHFLPDLKVSLKGGYDYSDSEGSIITDPLASWTYASSTGVDRRYNQNKKTELFDFFLTYNKDLDAIDSKIEAMAGYEWQHFWSKYDALEKDREDNVIENSKDETENYLVSYFGRLNYTFKDRYLLTATLRRDGSSRFHPDNKWGVFPSAALGWRINNENFMKSLDFVSNLKLRLSYGITGQQELNSGDYPYLGTYMISDNRTQYQFGDRYLPLIRPNGYDEGIKWEETTTYNVGLDFGLFNERINGSVEFYKRKTKDLLNTIPVPAGANFTDRLLTNVGNLENKGFEVSLNALAISNNNFSWEIGLNAAYNENKITKLTNYDDPNYAGIEVGGISGVGVGNYIQVNAVGHPLNTFFVYEQAYDQNGKPLEGIYVDRNNDGQINSKDKYYAGSPAPKWSMGFSSNFTYKNFDFGFNGRIGLGNQIYNNVLIGARYQELTINDYLTNLPSDIKNTKFETAQQYSDYYLEDGDFLRLDNVQLGYNFKNLKPFGAKNFNLRVYSSVQNVFVVTNYRGLDPEINNGIDNDVYPRPRTFVFGINARF